MKNFWNFFAVTSPRAGYIFLGVAEAFWGLWYLNPFLQHALEEQAHLNLHLYFDPPTILGIFALVLGVSTLYANIKALELGRVFFGMVHIAFWSYVMISLGFESWISAGIPLASVLIALSMFLYVLQQLEER